MLRTRVPMVVALVVVGSACSSGNAPPSGDHGPGASGGVPNQGGSAGANAQAGTGASGAAGSLGRGGMPSMGGTSGGGPPMGGAGGSGGSERGGASSAGRPGTGGRSGSAGQAIGAGTGGVGASSGSAGRQAVGGSATGGAGNSGGLGGRSGSAGAGGGYVMQSAGCGKTPTLQNGTISLMFNNASRKYILRLPDGYDNSHPYRLVLAYSWSGGSATDVVNSKYFTFATQDSKNTIFAAPDATDGAGTWSNGDVAFTDAILAQLEGDLCIDETRLFATGFSFGAGMAMALGCTRADVFRAVAFFSGADLTSSCPMTLTKPIAYYASQASEDSNGLSTTSPITGEKRQADFAAVNGCMPEPASTTFPAAGQPHTCTNYKGCSAGHPTEYCVFNGPHGWEPKDPGQNMSWNAPEAWKFITQF